MFWREKKKFSITQSLNYIFPLLHTNCSPHRLEPRKEFSGLTVLAHLELDALE